jgi:CheY-like chemotaxis protein
MTIITNIPKYLNGDPLRIKQILLNLISNSLKFTSQGGIHIDVRCLQNQPSILLEFTVSDSGIGIPQNKIQSLFEAFTQVDSSTTRKYGGTGLGLQITKRLIELMGGEIRVESQLNEGSTFIFTVNLAAGSPTVTQTVERNTGHAPIAQKRILVAEDNQTNQIVISAMLKRLGYEFDICSNGQEAINALNTSTYSIVLMDCQMPIVDGFQATRNIRQQQNIKSTPIIALTAGVTDQEKKECFDAGMNDFLSKPIKLGLLKDALLKWT